MAVYDAFVQEVQTAGLGDKIEVSIIGCHGLCSMSPVVVLSDDTLYGHLRPQDVSKVV
jgi:NADH-quinone oxidoreductase subunit F